LYLSSLRRDVMAASAEDVMVTACVAHHPAAEGLLRQCASAHPVWPRLAALHLSLTPLPPAVTRLLYARRPALLEGAVLAAVGRCVAELEARHTEEAVKGRCEAATAVWECDPLLATVAPSPPLLRCLSHVLCRLFTASRGSSAVQAAARGLHQALLGAGVAPAAWLPRRYHALLGVLAAASSGAGCGHSAHGEPVDKSVVDFIDSEVIKLYKSSTDDGSLVLTIFFMYPSLYNTLKDRVSLNLLMNKCFI